MATIKEILQLGREQLMGMGESHSLEAEVLLAHALGKPRSHLFTWPEETVSAEILQDYASMIHARREGQPIAYLTGEREFWSMELKVSPATLIPRPETELLVEQALQRIPEQAAWQLLDLGTGSGAIALALARERPRCKVTATDICQAALAIAEENARNHEASICFIQSEWFSALPGQRFDMIVSNPPYIADQDPHLQQGDVRFEPAQALVAGPDGLDAYRAILASASDYLNAEGWLILEHGYNQAEAVQQLLESYNFQNISSLQDMAGQHRLTLGQNISRD